MRPFRTRLQLLLCVIALSVEIPAQISAQTTNGEWRSYGATKTSTKYSPLDQITKDNVKNLRVVWRQSAVPMELRAGRSAVPIPQNYQVTPLMVDGRLFMTTGDGGVAALDPGDGKVIWWYLPPSIPRDRAEAPPILPGMPPPAAPQESAQSQPAGPGKQAKVVLTGIGPNRGLAYWSDGRNDSRIIAISGSSLMALDPKTGKLVPGFGQSGVVSLLNGYDRLEGKTADAYGWSSLPIVVRDVIVVGGMAAVGKYRLPGDVRGFDVRTGKQLWIFHVVPRPGEFGFDTWPNDAWVHAWQGGVWGLMSADEELGYVYLPTEADGPSDAYGGNRPGPDLFSNSLICLDAKTGKRIWYFQGVHHDIWDWDFNAAPILVDITVDGKKIKAVAQLSKQAFTYVFDRQTGEPVWPIVERPVPQGDTPGEWYSPTQPFPTKPPAYDQQGSTENDLIDFTPELHKEALEIYNQYRHGPMFTPVSVADGPDHKKGTIDVPGTVTAVFNGGAVDPETGLLYVPSVYSGLYVTLVPNPDKTDSETKYVIEPDKTGSIVGWGRAAFLTMGPQGLPLFKPPYGRITAIDLNKGDIRWQVPNGDGPRDHPAIKNLNLPPLGQPGRAAPLLTKTLLFMGEGGNAGILTLPPFGGGKKFRAYDKLTGKVVWELELPGGTNGAPMTYMYQGKQYIVVAVGWQGMGGELVALALTDNPLSQSQAPTVMSNAAPPASSNAAVPNTSGSFAEQVRRGKEQFSQNCAVCHGEDLSGLDPAPALSGATFLEHWSSGSVGGLFDRISTTMPQTSPGSLTAQSYLDIVAYLLQANGFAPSKGELPNDSKVLDNMSVSKK